jgi:hypothetical protein
MTNPNSPAGSQQVAVDAALVVLKSMGLSLDDLTAPRDRAAVPTFAEYVPVVSAAVTDGTRKAACCRSDARSFASGARYSSAIAISVANGASGRSAQFWHRDGMTSYWPSVSVTSARPPSKSSSPP